MVYASTDDENEPGRPLAECDSASRVIKYVVVMGYRYCTYDLVEMRVHDIRVVADLNRHDPTATDPEEPVVYDGTERGLVTEEDQSTVDLDLSVLLGQLDIY